MLVFDKYLFFKDMKRFHENKTEDEFFEYFSYVHDIHERPREELQQENYRIKKWWCRDV